MAAVPDVRGTFLTNLRDVGAAVLTAVLTAGLTGPLTVMTAISGDVEFLWLRLALPGAMWSALTVLPARFVAVRTLGGSRVLDVSFLLLFFGAIVGFQVGLSRALDVVGVPREDDLMFMVMGGVLGLLAGCVPGTIWPLLRLRGPRPENVDDRY